MPRHYVSADQPFLICSGSVKKIALLKSDKKKTDVFLLFSTRNFSFLRFMLYVEPSAMNLWKTCLLLLLITVAPQFLQASAMHFCYSYAGNVDDPSAKSWPLILPPGCHLHLAVCGARPLVTRASDCSSQSMLPQICLNMSEISL